MKWPQSFRFLVLGCLMAASACLLYNGGIISKHLHFLNQGFRLNDLPRLTKAYEITHQLMMAYMDDRKPNLEPIENWADDLGMYYFVPGIQRLLNTSLFRAYILVYGGSVLLGFFIACLGMKLLLKDKKLLWFSYVCLALTAFVMLFILDNYVLAYLVTSFIPLLLWAKQKYRSDKKIGLPLLLIALTGLLTGVANSFRVYSGWGMALIIVTYLLTENEIAWRIRLLFLAAFFVTTPVCKVVISCSLNQRNEWIKTHDNCAPNNNISSHVVWHNLYTGLGIIPNNYGITWSDENAFNVARKDNPGLEVNYYNVTNQYDNAIKQEYINVIKTHPFFVLKTLLLKLFYCLLLAFIFFNYGIFLLKRSIPTYKNALPLLAGISFYMLPGILVYPFPMYIVGALNLLTIAMILLADKRQVG